MSLPAAVTWPMAPWPQTETSMAGSRWSAGGLSHDDISILEIYKIMAFLQQLLRSESVYC